MFEVRYALVNEVFCIDSHADIDQSVLNPGSVPNTSLFESEGVSSSGAESVGTFAGGALLAEQIEGSSSSTASGASNAEAVVASGLVPLAPSQLLAAPVAVTGWTPQLATVLFRRLIGVLGDINQISDAALHLRVIEYLEKHIISKLIEVRVSALHSYTRVVHSVQYT